MNIANLLTTKGKPVVTIRFAQSVTEAVALLAEQSLGALVVVDGESKPIGIVTERHIVRRLATDDQILTRAWSRRLRKMTWHRFFT
jgi:CBS domain-containing protein